MFKLSNEIDVLVSFVVELRHNSVKLIKTDNLVRLSLLVNMRTVHHLQNVVVVQIVLQFLAHHLELLKVNRPVPILVEQIEYSFHPIFGLRLSNSGTNYVQKLIEVDWAFSISKSTYKLKDEGVSLANSKFFKSFVDLSRVDGSTTILIKDFEGIFELIIVFRGDSILPGGGCWCSRCLLWLCSSAHKICP